MESETAAILDHEQRFSPTKINLRFGKNCTAERKLSRRPKFAFCLTAVAFFSVHNLLTFRDSFTVSFTGTIPFHFSKSDDNNEQARENENLELDLYFEDTIDAAYSEWLFDQNHNLSYYHASNTSSPFYLEYKATSGLGHQLIRMASAYHFAGLYNIPYVFPISNRKCGPARDDVYDHLLGEGRMLPVVTNEDHRMLYGSTNSSDVFLPTGWPKREKVINEDNRTELSHTNRIEICNEVPGYVPFEFYDLIKHNFYGKTETDFQFYKQLMTLFEAQHHQRIQRILDETLFAKHTVFGLHVRAGNGEEGDFAMKKRGIEEVDQWLRNVGEMLCDYSVAYSYHFKEHPLMIYLGTDTGSVITKFRAIMNSLSSSGNCSNIPVIAAEQVHPEAGSGVSFSQDHKNRSDCIEGWESMFIDQYFFTKCNTIIAGQYSSFTQAAPLSYMMRKYKHQSVLSFSSSKNEKNSRHRRHLNYFCEVSTDGRRMDCYDNMASFLLSKKRYSFGDPKAPAPRFRRVLKFPTSTDKTPDRIRKQQRELFKRFRGSPIRLKSPHPLIE